MGRPAHRPTESLTATLGLGGHDFTFRLFTRPLQLGPGVPVQYYWMDNAQFRIARKQRGADPANFRNCISHRWAAMQSVGLGGDLAQIQNLLLATSFALVSRSNALQKVYRDAYLVADATNPQDRSLSEPVRDQIREVVRSRDAGRTREALDEWLGWRDVPEDQAILSKLTLDGILQYGVERVRQRGNNGLLEFVGRVDAWFQTRLKKGDQGWLRPFLHRFAYACKVSFYRCYANTWVDLIPWLRRHRGLDLISERFLRFWHMQNQPAEGTDGRVIPDAFRGQVLSLHPLSGFFMMDPALCAIAGQFFGTDAHDRVMVHGQAEACDEYWNLIGAILTAAGLYHQALDEQNQRRGVTLRAVAAPDLAVVPAENRSAAGLLQEFVKHHGLRCSTCGGELTLQKLDPEDVTPEGLDAPFHCRRCGRAARHFIGQEELSRWLFPPA
jgi:hypothetical protein